jgi:hypothetical protein
MSEKSLRPRPAKGHTLEKSCFLCDERKTFSELVDVNFSNILAVEQNSTALGLVESRNLSLVQNQTDL